MTAPPSLEPLRGSRCVVTGGAGLVGSHIVGQLVAAGAGQVVVLDLFGPGMAEEMAQDMAGAPVRVEEADLRDAGAVRAATSGADYVFHQAALALRPCQDQPRRAVEVNVVGTFNVLEAAVEAGVGKVVAASSSSVYGEALYLPTDEAHPFNTDLFYGATKVAGEQLLRCFHKAYGLAYVALRYLNIYGPHRAYGPANVDVFGHFARRIEAGEPPRIDGDGSATMDLVYVGDAARANLLAAVADVEAEVLNIASGRETTVRELAETMVRVYGRPDLAPECTPRDSKLVARRWGTADRAREVLGFEAEVDLEEGLRRIVEFRAAMAG
ncbi:MAG: NAD-dependent epimerase/dehydratase family protein [Acidimicrobiales bacterium]